MSWAINSDEMQGAKIKVIGVGGGGGNALNCIATEGKLGNVDYIAVNTDIQALKVSKATEKIQIGTKLTHGLGAGGKPEVGESSAQESKEEIAEAIKDADMVFITAGMGGGTGTGAAPVVAEIAKQLGILTVAVVTKPFNFEGARKMTQAEKGIGLLLENVDSLVVIPNQNLLIGEAKLTMRQSFNLADNVLKTNVTSIAELILSLGYMNVDFADITSIMKNAGYAHIAVGSGQGKDKVADIARQVVSSPLLETSIKSARRVLLNIVMTEDVQITDVDDFTKIIHDAIDPEANMIFGTGYTEEGSDTISVTIIATDFGDAEIPEIAPVSGSSSAGDPIKPTAKIPENSYTYDDIFNVFK
ncbi:MAG: cell division protein FtsZ [Oscillospiraceae bacterium]